MLIWNATDVPIEVREMVLRTGRSMEVEKLTDMERRCVDLGILTTYWPAPVSKIANRFRDQRPQALKAVYARF